MAAEDIKVLIVDDHPFIRSGIAAVMQVEEGFFVVGEAGGGQEAIESFRKHRPDVTLMDLQMPDMNGIDAIVAIRREFPEARFVVLTTYQGDVQAVRALKAGAGGYLLKSMLREQMIQAVRKVHAGGRFIPAEIAATLAEHVADDPLSVREIEVLRMVAAGSSDKIIASRLELSEATVKSHLKNILSKLGADNRTHAVTLASKRGFLDG